MKREQGEIDGDQTPDNDGPPIKLIALAIVVALLAVFFFQNGEKAPVDFLFWGGKWPVWLVIGVSVVIGIVIDRLAAWQWSRARRKSE